jgi:hypothetical protein
MALTKTPIELSSTPSIVDGGNATAITIDSSERVGLGTVNPASILHIEGNTNEYASSPILYFGSTSTANAAVRDWAIGPADDDYGNFHIFRGTSTGSNPIGNDGRVFTIASAGGVRIGDSVGTGYGLTADIGTAYGAIIQTTESTPSANPALWVRVDDDGSVGELFRVQNNGLVRAKNGIHFGSDTAAANALDDYEEGSWTPAVGGSSGNPTISYTLQAGKYVKIGRMVKLFGRIRPSSVSGGSGGVQITGLPFTPSNDSDETGGSIGLALGFSTVPNNLQVDDGNSVIYVLSSAANNLITDFDFSYLYFQIDYLVD